MQTLVVAVILLGFRLGRSRLISDAHAEVTDASPVAAPSASASPMPTLGPAIYTTLPSLDTVAVYPLASNGNVPSLVGNAAISNPGGIGYWAGRVYVANVAANSITVYPAGANGSTNPIVTIEGEDTLLDSPTAIAFDSYGNIYVANAGKGGGGQDSITKYPAGSSGDAAPVAEIKGDNTKLFSPSGLTVDSSGNIYVANPGLISYAANQKPMVQVADSITVYSPSSTGNTAPVRVISGALTRLSSVSGIAVDSSGYIYADSRGVEGSQAAGILIFAPGSSGNVAPTMSLNGDCANLNTTGPIALDANANIYVGDYDKIVFFVHDDLFSQRTEPRCMDSAFQISGSQTGIKEITGISVDSVGDIFVTDSDRIAYLPFNPAITETLSSRQRLPRRARSLRRPALHWIPAVGFMWRMVTETARYLIGSRSMRPAAMLGRRLSEASKATRPVLAAHSQSRLVGRARFT